MIYCYKSLALWIMRGLQEDVAIFNYIPFKPILQNEIFNIQINHYSIAIFQFFSL